MSGAVLEGVVTSDKRDKTVTVRVQRRVRHPFFGKVLRIFKKYAAHDAHNRCKEGDVVKIRECRPHSKTKTWEVVGDPKAEQKEGGAL